MADTGIGSGVGSILGGVAGLALAGSGGEKYLKEAADAMRQLKQSDFDYTKLSAPQLQMIQKVYPQVYSAVVPKEAQTITGDAGAQAAQQQVLGQYGQIAQQGLPVGEKLAAEQAQQSTGAELGRAQQAIRSNMAARGQLGSGQDLMSRLAGAQQGVGLAAQQGKDLASLGESNKLQGMSAEAALAGQMRGQTTSEQGQNADIMNRYNQLIAQMQTQAAQENAAAQERAQGYNVGTQQRISETNPMLAYSTNLENINRANNLKNMSFNQGLQKATGLSNVLGKLAQETDQQRQQKIQAATQIGSGVGGLGENLFSAF